MALLNSSRFTIEVHTDADTENLAFAHTQSASVSYSNEMVEATLGVSNSWAEFLPGKRTVSISFDGLYDYGTIVGKYNSEELGDFLIDENLLYFQIGDGLDNFMGRGYVSEITQSGSTDGVATYSGVLTVVGEVILNINVDDLETLEDSDGFDIQDDSGQTITVVRRR